MVKGLRVSLVIGLMVHAGWAFNANAQSVSNLHSFGSSPNDGSQPEAGLVQGSDSNFYGTTFGGGNSDSGVVFRITPSGSFTNLHLFAGHTDGAAPEAPLVQGFDGNFYGTTYYGGTNGMGAVFKMTSQGTLTTLWQFSGGSDGAEPQAGLVQGSDSNFYGTTSGGASTNCLNGCGSVFKITSTGTLTTLWHFTGASDGGTPSAGLVRGIDGSFYGTTYGGGTNRDGTVFRITSAGTLTPLWQFSNGADGARPYADLVQGSDSNLYGTTLLGGVGEHGVVYKITTAGTMTPLWQFTGGADGANPTAGLVQGNDGLFYGTASGGGTNGWGVIFRISSTGAFTNLYLFTGGADGGNPAGPLIQSSDGNFYGTTQYGGTNDEGGVFKLIISTNSITPPPTLTQISRIQIIGTNVDITIPAISNQIYQLQYSSSMTPTNWVDTGNATNGVSGTLQLIDLGGALQSHRFYRIDIAP